MTAIEPENVDETGHMRISADWYSKDIEGRQAESPNGSKARSGSKYLDDSPLIDDTSRDFENWLHLEEEDVPVLIDGMFTRVSNSIIFGGSGSGKSWLLGEIALAVAAPISDAHMVLGQRIHVEEADRVLWCYGTEDTERRVRTRIRKTWSNSNFQHLAPRERAIRICPVGAMNSPKGFDQLRREIDAHGSTIVFFDTVSSTTSKLEVSDNDKVSDFLSGRMHRLRDEHNVSTVSTMHVRKATSDRQGKLVSPESADSILGAASWRNLSDALLFFSAIDGNTADIRSRMFKSKDIAEWAPSDSWELDKRLGRIVRAEVDYEDVYSNNPPLHYEIFLDVLRRSREPVSRKRLPIMHPELSKSKVDRYLSSWMEYAGESIVRLTAQDVGKVGREEYFSLPKHTPKQAN